MKSWEKGFRTPFCVYDREQTDRETEGEIDGGRNWKQTEEED